MRIAFINTVTYGSTGNIMLQIAEEARLSGHMAVTYSPYPYSSSYAKLPISPLGHRYFGTWMERWIHNLIGRVVGCDGRLSKSGTKKLVKMLRKDKIELLHLHNLHGYCINLPILFKYIKKDGIKVVWTLHDCWSFTGHCPYYDIAGCEKWKQQCKKCPQLREYPQCRLDNARSQYDLKKRCFLGLEDILLVTPSKWLKSQVKQSFLKDYPVQVVYNGIDLDVYHETQGNFKERYACEDKKIVLGVAFDWGKRKGLDIFVKLSQQLDESYQVVLVGTSDAVDEMLPQNILSIHRTQSQNELAEIYSAADVFVNPTREEVLGLVNIEALACGTPVVTFKTGGSPECVDETCGIVVEKDDFDSMLREIVRICTEHPYCKEDCIRMSKFFDKKQKYMEYVKLYEEDWNHHTLLP